MRLPDSPDLADPYLEPHTLVFVIKVWAEKDEGPDAGPDQWRGQIIHVTSGRQQAVTNLQEIAAFMDAYLEKFGAKPSLHSRLFQWFKSWNPLKIR